MNGTRIEAKKLAASELNLRSANDHSAGDFWLIKLPAPMEMTSKGVP